MGSEASHTLASAATPPPRSRRLLQISLRTLFILFTAGCVWLGVVTKRARDQRAAVIRILELGGSVSFDYEFDKSGKRIKDAQPPGWPWLRREIGDEYFRDVVWVTLDNTSVTDDDLRLLGKLRATKTLALNHTGVSDVGLAHISHLRRLEYLGLAETRITDEGLRQVEKMAQLKSLILGETGVGDDAVIFITMLKRLEFVNLQSTRITSDGVKELSRLSKLTGLCLSDTEVDDSAVESIGSIKSLAELELTATNISGEGLLRISDELPSCYLRGDFVDSPQVEFALKPPISRWSSFVEQLKSLNNKRRLKLVDFSKSQITDRFLPDIYTLNHVEVIDLRDTKVTDVGVEALRKSLKNCRVER